jgi:serine/threonine-protein kinase TTK/MPS1
MTAAAAAPVHPQSRRPSIDNNQARPAIDQRPSRQVSSYNLATSRYASQKAQSDALEDQENMPPPTFRRNKDQEFKYLGKPTVSATSDDEKAKVEETPVPVSGHEQRNPLVSVSGNTPHRPAPAPPPKMSVLDAATSNAGASTTKIKKKRNHIIVKGKIFTQMGKIGKGGSSDVYCVMAENYKTFALKRVKLEDCDENAVRGYKGEIDLLKKLTEVERVVRLIDWELNDDKQELVVLMEKGDTDLARVLTMRLNEPDARFDSAFTRYHWREMLECVQAVHDYDIVHSDLKPANFLLVQGRLKLIDFGIANAIDIDHTINVHRDSHVGTPNYMSPESITDTNAHSNVKDDAGRPLKKDMRIGKSSDIWSLGCILYQMAYGRPPFAHIQNTYQRIMAITNRHHIIEFPNTGVGGSHIPSTLKGTLRKCLNRDPDRRPLIKDMLSDSDPYLNPEGIGNAVLMDEALLGQIINKVLERCRDPNKGIPPHEEAQAYPKSFMNKIRQMQEER